MEPEKLNFDEDVKINLLMLHTEWLDQPQRFHSYSKALADAERDLRELKTKVDVAKAELASDIRKNPAVYGCDKVTEGVVAETLARALGEGFKHDVTMAKTYRQLYNEHLDKEYEVDLCQAAVRAFDQRKAALEAEVKLHGQNYYATPTVAYEDAKTFRDKVDEQGRDQARDRGASAMREGRTSRRG